MVNLNLNDFAAPKTSSESEVVSIHGQSMGSSRDRRSKCFEKYVSMHDGEWIEESRRRVERKRMRGIISDC